MSADRDREIVELLADIRSLLAVMATKGLEQQRDQIEMLAKAGFEPKEIADFLNTTRNTVSVALTKLRKEGRLPKL